MVSAMKRIVVLLAIVMLTALMTGCGKSEIRVEGEEGSCDIYTYPADNMLGLEKMVLFDDHAVAVFDARKSDEGYAPIEDLYKQNINRFVVSLDNICKSKIVDGSIEKVEGRYVITARCTYDEADKIDPDLPVKATGLIFANVMITCSENHTKLQYSRVDSEYTEIACQEYSMETGKWSEIDEESYDEPAMTEYSK